jgi:hypothetical protein
MAKPVFVPNATELAGARGPFLYELEMLRLTTDLFIVQSPVLADPTLKRALLESALVHARNLLDFFTLDPSPSDDILAAHFIAQPDGSSWKPTGLTHLASRRGDINKALSHLTYTRVVHKPGWPFYRIRSEIETAYTEFIAALPESDRTGWQA